MTPASGILALRRVILRTQCVNGASDATVTLQCAQHNLTFLMQWIRGSSQARDVMTRGGVSPSSASDYSVTSPLETQLHESRIV